MLDPVLVNNLPPDVWLIISRKVSGASPDVDNILEAVGEELMARERMLCHTTTSHRHHEKSRQLPPHFLLERSVLPIRPVATVSVHIRQATVIKSRTLKHANKYYKIVVDTLTAWEKDTSVGIVAPQLDVRNVKANITLSSA